MNTRATNTKIRRRQVREQRAKADKALWRRLMTHVASWPVFVGVAFVAAASTIALTGEETIRYSVGERIDQPIYAMTRFEVEDEEQTRKEKDAARDRTPSYYTRNDDGAVRIKADLHRLYQEAVDADTFEAFSETMESFWAGAQPGSEPTGLNVDQGIYQELHEELGSEEKRPVYEGWVDRMPFGAQYVVRERQPEARGAPGTANFILVSGAQGGAPSVKVALEDVVIQTSQTNLGGSANRLAKRFPIQLRPVVEEIALVALRQQPTILYDSRRTIDEMKLAEEATPAVMVVYEKGEPFITGMAISAAHYDLLQRHQEAYQAYRIADAAERHRWQWQRAGLVVMVSVLSLAIFVYTGTHHRRVFENRTRTLGLVALLLGTLIAARALYLNWPQYPEFVLVPCLVAGSVLTIVYPRRFALGVMCIAAILTAAVVRGDLPLVLVLLTGLAATAYQLDDIRTRTKITSAGALSALAVALVAASGALLDGQAFDFVFTHSLAAASGVMLSALLVSVLLPFIEKLFGVATALSLLEWTDSRNELLQLLARQAPGTYNHSLVLSTLAEAACGRIGANGQLAQVGALYHDIGKIPKAEYFAENQEGRINRHDNLAPTMSLLIILGHVKDGIEMAREYKLPRVLHQFIEEHHGTTVVRYFHHVASEKQPQIASGKHDREVPETEFRYAGPKPRTRESAVVMLCDGVESTVRSLSEPTAGRIENVVHQIVTERLNDGQFDDCDITLREVSLVEDSLVKSLCSIYHGRVAYPKMRKPEEDRVERAG